MSDGRVTSSNIKKINRNRVYRTIYRERTTSKFQLVQLLEMGLSTVSYNLADLNAEGLLRFDGYFESTGGRRANRIQIDPTARIAIGIGILSDRLHFVAIDLYGQLIHKNTFLIPYEHAPQYYQSVGGFLEQFISGHAIDTSRVLGVAIATQGIVSRDGGSIDYGTLMQNSKMTLADLKPYIPFPCRMEHDSKAAGNLVLWNYPDVQNAIVLLLNHNLGSAVIADHIVQRGDHMRSGLIEHMCMHEDGPLCYCGKRGCLETYCSAERLERDSGMDVPAFFTAMQATGAPKLRHIWEDFLSHLAFAIRNLSVIFDGAFILTGYLTPYISKEDAAALLDMINVLAPWPLSEDQLLLGSTGQYAPALGAALRYVSEFIDSV